MLDLAKNMINECLQRVKGFKYDDDTDAKTFNDRLIMELEVAMQIVGCEHPMSTLTFPGGKIVVLRLNNPEEIKVIDQMIEKGYLYTRIDINSKASHNEVAST